MPKTRNGDLELKKLHFSNRPFYSCGLSTLAFETVKARLRMTLFWYKPDYTRKMLVSIYKNNMIYITNQERLNFAKKVNSILVSIYNCEVGYSASDDDEDA